MPTLDLDAAELALVLQLVANCEDTTLTYGENSPQHRSWQALCAKLEEAARQE